MRVLLPWWLRISTVIVALCLQGCVNLEAVREYGKTASELSSYPDAGKAFEDSGRTAYPYLSPPPSDQDRRIRHVQVEGAVALQATLSAYFATLSKLAGEDAFSLDKEIDAIAAGLQTLPAGAVDAETAAAAIGLTKSLQKYVLAPVQAHAVRELVTTAGPPAMRVAKRLELLANGWQGMVRNDRADVVNLLGTLASASDTPILLKSLSLDRKSQIEHSYDAYAKRIDLAEKGLEKIQDAHTKLLSQIDRLDGAQLKEMLKNAVADLKSIRSNIENIR